MTSLLRVEKLATQLRNGARNRKTAQTARTNRGQTTVFLL
jgi:hypothetical protein